MDLLEKNTWQELLYLPATLRARIWQYCLDKDCFQYEEREFHTLFLDGEEELEVADVTTELSAFEESGGQFLFYFDDDYPTQLREIQNAPPILLIYGEVSLLSEPSISVIGTHKMRHYGRAVTKFLTKGLCKQNMVVVTGILHGVEETAARSVLKVDGNLICVLPSGFNVPYPLNNQELFERIKALGNVLVSEYLPNQQARKNFFEERSRIMSGLTKGVLITEAEEKSGSLVTASYALEQNREIFVVPGNIFATGSGGTNGLISEGAKLVSQSMHIIEEIN
ncbi:MULTISPECIES: DNA-processing protein DprA [Listeria]|uniref:DNA-processing protein DprA n=1 Tax=Listeria TaxID=1637 RepID=UPI000B58C26D|nr:MULTISPECIES: DNA-processing protein DprA [Listeria]